MRNRTWVCLGIAMVTGALALQRMPFPSDNELLALVALESPLIFTGIKSGYLAMLFTTPFIACSVITSLGYIFVARAGQAAVAPTLPAYPAPARRKDLFLLVGELHHPKRPLPIETPRWLTLPQRGLYTGVIVFGAIGSGKTTACMIPFAQQILGYCASDALRRIGGLVLEVKGDFCHTIHRLLEKAGRSADYVEVSLTSDIRYNPLHNDLDAYALAYGISSLLNNLFGKGREPFWQQAYTNLVKFVILLHKVVDDYVTLFDVYQGAINPAYLEAKIKMGETRENAGSVVITFDDFMAVRELENFPFERDGDTDRMKAPASQDLRELLESRGIRCGFEPDGGNGLSPWTEEKRQQFQAVKRWFYQDWLEIDKRLRTSIVEGIAVFLSLFDDNPAVKRVFCPPKETYDPVANADGRWGRPLPSFTDLIEQGAVCALNFPVSANPGLARTIGTLMKLDFQRAMLNRIDEQRPVDPRDFRRTEEAATIDAALPGTNVVTRDHSSARAAFRESIFEVFADVVVDEEDRARLIDTYEILLGQKPQGRGQMCPYDADGCDQHVMIANALSSCSCDRRRPVYSTDALRIHEAFRDFGTNGEAFGEVMQVWERMLLVHLLRCFERRGWLGQVGRLAFFLDGPLAVFGHPAWLSAAIEDELKRLNGIVRGETGNDLIILGVEKTGTFVEHFSEIDITEVPGERLFAPRSYMLLTDRYIKTRIIYSDSPKRYGVDTYFGRKFFYKTRSGAQIVANLSYLTNEQDTLSTDDVEPYPQFGTVCALLDSLVSSRFTNAIAPLVSAHAHAAIPLHIGARVLEQLARALMREG